MGCLEVCITRGRSSSDHVHSDQGTGKTSLIKAIAQYTKRHIVSVSLDRISTNQELMDMMFDKCVSVCGRGGSREPVCGRRAVYVSGLGV